MPFEPGRIVGHYRMRDPDLLCVHGESEFQQLFPSN